MGGVSDTMAPLPRLWAARDLDGIKPVQWLAKGRLPRGAVTILVGDEGIGKSLLWVWVAAAITTGRALPEFGIPERAPGRVLLVLTEDDWSSTVRPRLEVAGADLAMIAVICEEKDGSGSPVFPRDMPLIQAAPVALVVVDAFLDTVAPGLSMKDPQQARQALHPWREAALTTGSSVLLVTHTNRMDSKNPRDKYGISGELRKKARMTLYAQRDDEDRLVVGPEKTNIAGRTAASMFTIEPVQVFEATEDADGTVPRLRFVGESEMTAKEIVAATYDAQRDTSGSDREDAREWLTSILDGPGGMLAVDIKRQAARDLACSWSTVQRAARDLNVDRTSRVGNPPTPVWKLPAETPGGQDPTCVDSVTSGDENGTSSQVRAERSREVTDSHLTSGDLWDLTSTNTTESVPGGHADRQSPPVTSGRSVSTTKVWTDPEWNACTEVAGQAQPIDAGDRRRWRAAGQPAITTPQHTEGHSNV